MDLVMSNNEIQNLRNDLVELKEAIHAVNDRIQLWTIEDYNWKKEEVKKREALEKSIQKWVTFFDDWARAKKVIFWIMGGLSAILAFYLLAFEVVKTLLNK